ncbi:MAG TPA: 23S rRNA (guanosine(2251)-2'-O)-methyltransferase RlmB [Candidatus Wirthbacteria bacterium]|nr:23S rRNA (guanosine(2251)-2'-O)-methyltransferase RlmB [Candidatus Wirthbacteria bacterium]
MPYEFISGRHAVLSVLTNPRRVPSKLFIQNDLPASPVLSEINSQAKTRNVEIKQVSRFTLEKKFSQSGRSHQGVVLISSPFPYYQLDYLLAKAAKQTVKSLILDHIHDPHNLGALCRTAEIAGFDAVIIPKDRACEVTPTVAKTSAGASEIIPIIKVTNLNQTIDKLKEAFITVIGLETGGDKNIYQLNLTGSVALVVGNEGKGIAQLTQKKCDTLTEIPMHGQTASLNASVAGAIAMFEVVRQGMGKK